jgi:hypothetical protein
MSEKQVEAIKKLSLNQIPDTEKQKSESSQSKPTKGFFLAFSLFSNCVEEIYFLLFIIQILLHFFISPTVSKSEIYFSERT